MHYRFAASLLVLALVAPVAAYAADDKAEGNKVERAAERTGRAIDKTVRQAGNWADRTARKAAKAVGRAAEKTDNWIRKKTE